MKWETVAEANLKRLRMAHGLTQVSLAKAAKIDLR
jgi:DNA-binding XRE family transcriptional regulator